VGPWWRLVIATARHGTSFGLLVAALLVAEGPRLASRGPSRS